MTIEVLATIPVEYRLGTNGDRLFFLLEFPAHPVFAENMKKQQSPGSDPGSYHGSHPGSQMAFECYNR
jgi:hypothetical protein